MSDYPFCVVKARKGNQCYAYCCKKQAEPGRSLCRRHREIAYKHSRPIEWRFNKLKHNARRRGKPFRLTLEEFRSWAIEHGYLDEKGHRRANMTIDRIDSTKGYELDNIQVLHLRENSAKAYDDWVAQQRATASNDYDDPFSDLPF